MEKTEDFNVSELQELVIKHNCGKKHTSLTQKSMIVKSYLLNHVPLEQLSKDFGVSVRSIRRWISTFAEGKVPQRNSPNTSFVKPNPSIMPKKIQKPVETEAEELVRLREENKRLAEALKMAEWMNHAKDVMIDEAEKMFNIPIRKKAGAKQ